MIKSVLKLMLPPALKRLYHSNGMSIKKHGGLYGTYNTWEEAQRKAQGYDAAHILNQVADAMQDVIDDPERFERDGVILSEKDYSYPTLAYLAKWAMLNNAISVLDIGGSLGSLYYQFKKFYPTIKNVTWTIVEQPHFVAKGNTLFSSDTLYFYDAIDDAVCHSDPNVVLFSGALQYFPLPYQWLSKASKLNNKHLIIDRMPVFNKNSDQITLQYVPERIYKSSYPAWIFSKPKLLENLSADYSLIHEFPALDGHTYLGLQQVDFRGFILERKQ